MKTKFGAIVVAGSGRLGGHSMGSGKLGSYLCNHTTRKKTVTADQQNNRIRVNKINRHWNGLTSSQKLAFDGAVGDWLGTDMFGDVVKLTGKQLHFKFNMNNLLAGQGQISVPPQKIKIPFKETGLIRYIGINNIVSIVVTANGYTGFKALVYISKIKKNGVTVKESDLFFLGIGNVNLNVINIINNREDKTGVVTPSSNISFYYKLVSPQGIAGQLLGGKMNTFL